MWNQVGSRRGRLTAGGCADVSGSALFEQVRSVERVLRLSSWSISEVSNEKSCLLLCACVKVVELVMLLPRLLGLPMCS